MKKLLMLSSLLSLVSGAVLAAPGGATESTNKKNETVAFVGLQWNFGSSSPELVLGGRTTRSNNTTSVAGAKFDIAIPLNAKTWNQPTVRLLGLGGSCDVQGEAGVGYGFATKAPVFALGVQAPFANAGINYSIPNKFSPYIGMNSLRKPACAFKTSVAQPT